MFLIQLKNRGQVLSAVSIVLVHCICFYGNGTSAEPEHYQYLRDRTICTNVVSNRGVSGGSTSGVLAVAKCPPDALASTADKCHQSNSEKYIEPDKVPVLDRHGQLYLNQYCLICNNPAEHTPVHVPLNFVNISCTRNVTSSERERMRLHRQGGPIVLPDDCRGTFYGSADIQLDDCCLISNSSPCLSKASTAWANSVDIVFNFRVDFFNLSGRSKLTDRDDIKDSDGNSTISVASTAESYCKTFARTVLLIISMLSLLCLIAVYCCCCLPGLRNRPAYLLVSHSFALLLVYAIDLIDLMGLPSFSRQHQLWLYSVTVFAADAAFCWALLFGCDLLRALSGLGVNNTGGGNVRQASDRRSKISAAIRFSLIGWGIPLLFSAAPIATQHMILNQQQQRQQQLGNSTEEGFTNWRLLQLGIVFGPWAATLALNCVALAAIWRRIFLAAQNARQRPGCVGGGVGSGGHTTRGFSKAKQLAATALKVSALLGVCWLPFCLAIALGWPNQSIGFFLGQLCRSCQGALLLAAFGSSARVRRQLAARLASRRSTTATGGTSGSNSRGRRNTGATTCGNSGGATVAVSRPLQQNVGTGKSSAPLLRRSEECGDAIGSAH